jgi:hypothetical protein
MSNQHPPKLTLIHTLPVEALTARTTKGSWPPVSIVFDTKPTLAYSAKQLCSSIVVEDSIAEELNGMVKPDSIPLMVEKISRLMTHKLNKSCAHLMCGDDCPKTPA